MDAEFMEVSAEEVIRIQEEAGEMPAKDEL